MGKRTKRTGAMRDREHKWLTTAPVRRPSIGPTKAELRTLAAAAVRPKEPK